MVSPVFAGSSCAPAQPGAEAAQLWHSLCPQNPLILLMATGIEQVKTEASEEQADVSHHSPPAQQHRLRAQPNQRGVEQLDVNWPFLTFLPVEKPQKDLPHLCQWQRTWP